MEIAALITVRALLESELSWANDRYREINFMSSHHQDFIAVAEVDGTRAGIGRLVAIDETTGELGGMYVFDEFRNQGIAGAIVTFLLEHSPYQQLFCIPFAHLEGFYGGFGFKPVSADMDVPCTVSGKVDWCRDEYPTPVALLVRVAT